MNGRLNELNSIKKYKLQKKLEAGEEIQQFRPLTDFPGTKFNPSNQLVAHSIPVLKTYTLNRKRKNKNETEKNDTFKADFSSTLTTCLGKQNYCGWKKTG